MTQKHMTPQQFTDYIPEYYKKYTTGKYFPGWIQIENTLTPKAKEMGYLNKSDLVEIAKWGGNQYNRAGKVKRENTEQDVMTKTARTIETINDPSLALISIIKIRQWGLTYGSKTLRAICPERYGALDRILLSHIDRKYLSSFNTIEKYVQFLQLCNQIKVKAIPKGPRKSNSWYIADIEMAMFQYTWDDNYII